MKKTYLSLLMAMVCSWGFAQTVFEMALANQTESDAFVASLPTNFASTGTISSSQWGGTYGVKINGNSSLTYTATGLTAGDYTMEAVIMAQNVSHLWVQDVWPTGGTVATPVANAGTAGSYVTYTKTVTIASDGDYTFGIVRPSAGSQLFVKEWKVTPDAGTASSSNDILTFVVSGQTKPETIDTENHTVAIEVAHGTDVTTLTPTFTTSPSSTVSPLSGAVTDFTNPVVYTVTAEDATPQDWIVSVSVGDPLPPGTLFEVALANQTGAQFFVANLPTNFAITGTVTADSWAGIHGAKIAGNSSVYYTATGLAAGEYTMEGVFMVQDIATLPWIQDIWATGGTAPTASAQPTVGTSTEFVTYTKTVTVASPGDYTFGILLGNTGVQFFLKEWKVFEAVAVNTWNGSAWSGGNAPTAGDDAVIAGDFTSGSLTANNITINSGATVTIASGESLTANGDLTITGVLNVASGGSLITLGAVTGNATISRNTTFGDTEPKYSFVGTPVAFDAGITGAGLGSNVFKYNEATAFDADQGLARWEDAAADALVPGVGYTQTNQKVITFTGVPNTGIVTVPGLTKTTTGSAVDAQGWHLLSNPFAAAIDVAQFLAANTASVENSISIWDDGVAAVGGRGNGGSYLQATSIATVNGSSKNFEGYIGSTQGFFVKALNAGVDVSFTSGMTVTGNNADATFFRKAGNTVNAGIKVSIANADFFNELFVGLDKQATVGYDAKLEATKLIGGTDLEFYSLANNSKYAILALPFEAGIATELAFNVGTDAQLKFTVEELNGLEDGMTFWLHDAVTGQSYDLNQTQSFTFSASAGSDQNRFTLTYASARVLANSLTKNQPIYRYIDGSLNVDFANALNIAEYVVYDISGKVIVQKNVSNLNTQNLNIPVLSKGINIVKISTSEGVYTRKFIF